MIIACAIRVFACLCFIAVVLPGCSARRMDLDLPASSGASEIILPKIGYDEHGRPVLGPPLAERPSGPGARFTIVRTRQDLPELSYDIAVTGEKPAFTKPFQVMYEWTGKGFEVSAVFAHGLRSGTYSNEEALAALAFVAAPAAVGAMGGFVIGVVDGIRHTALELGKIGLHGNEQVVTCTFYHYDSQNRLVLMRMLSPDRKQELVRTEFVYEGDAEAPVRTTVKSRAEGKERDVR